MSTCQKARRSWIILLLSFFLFIPNVYANYETWQQVADEMSTHFEAAQEAYEKGDGKLAKDEINVAYFQFYEKLGFEKTVKSYISGRRVKNIEYQFHDAKRLTNEDNKQEELKALLDELDSNIHEDAHILDGTSQDEQGATENTQQTEEEKEAQLRHQAWTTFFASFGLTLREGLEAILIIAAILAYLTKTKNDHLKKGVYVGSLVGILFSGLLAFGFNYVTHSLGANVSGMAQEVFEGITMFIAVAVLFYVSNWMLSKAETEHWQEYIQGQVDHSVTKNSQLALSFSAFLAVAREGAELILFFQGLQINQESTRPYLWGGLLAAALCLVVIYFAIVKLSVHLPLKPFFYATSVLMFFLCISFTGKGVGELQEADVLSKTLVPWMNGFQIDLLGIYDTYESIIPQLIMVVLVLFMFVKNNQNNKKIQASYKNK